MENKTCPRCGTERPRGEVAHTCVARAGIDWKAAEQWARVNGLCPPRQGSNEARAYLALLAERTRANALLTRAERYIKWFTTSTVDPKDYPGDSDVRLSPAAEIRAHLDAANGERT